MKNGNERSRKKHENLQYQVVLPSKPDVEAAAHQSLVRRPRNGVCRRTLTSTHRPCVRLKQSSMYMSCIRDHIPLLEIPIKFIETKISMCE